MERLFYKVIDKLILGKKRINYRQALFGELKEYLLERESIKRILEIGPKDGEDTRRLLELAPERITLIDLADKSAQNKKWIEKIASDKLEYFEGNILYDKFFDENCFDLIWCTGVLYHNPEQLRMLRCLFDLLKPNGILVLETATIKESGLRNKNVVQILYPPSDKYKIKYHVSHNVTHLPSRSAVNQWLQMIGFEDIMPSRCLKKQSFLLDKHRMACICRKPQNVRNNKGKYYSHTDTSYIIGKSL